MTLADQGRILYISSVDISVGNGPGVNERQFTTSLYRALGERSHFLLPQPRTPIGFLPEVQCTFSHPHRHRHPLHWPRHVISQIQLARRLLQGDRFDLVVMRVDLMPLALAVIGRRSSVPYVTKTLSQTLLWMFSQRWGGAGRPIQAMNNRMVKALAANALVSDACSESQVHFFHEELGIPLSKLAWIDNGVDTDQFFPHDPKVVRARLGFDHLDPILGYVGGEPEKRGGGQLVEILPALRETFPQIGAVIVGSSPGLAKLKERANQLGVGDRCVFTGYIPFDQVPDHVNAFDIGVSISAGAERFAAAELKVRQYLACGKWVLAGPGSNDFLEEEALGRIVNPNDLQAIAAAATEWLSLPSSARSEQGERTVAYARRELSEDGALQKRLELWQRCLSPGDGVHRDGKTSA